MRKNTESFRGGSCKTRWNSICFRGCHRPRSSYRNLHRWHKFCSRRRMTYAIHAASSLSAETSKSCCWHWIDGLLHFCSYFFHLWVWFRLRTLPKHYTPREGSKDKLSFGFWLLTFILTVRTNHEFFSTSYTSMVSFISYSVLPKNPPNAYINSSLMVHALR